MTKVSDGHVVVGAGVMGLACALEIRRRGFEVTVFERGVPGREATWAAEVRFVLRFTMKSGATDLRAQTGAQ